MGLNQGKILPPRQERRCKYRPGLCMAVQLQEGHSKNRHNLCMNIGFGLPYYQSECHTPYRMLDRKRSPYKLRI